MNKFIIGLPLAALAAVSFGSAANASEWKHWGADPAYKTPAAAKADAANVFRRAGWPPKAISAMLEEMKKKPEKFELRNGDRLDTMRSGASALWHDVHVNFTPGKGVKVTVTADRWTVTVDGITYMAILPEVCNNLSTLIIRTPALCRIVNITTADDQEVAIHHRYESDDECWGERDADYVGQPEGEGKPFVKPGPCPDGPCNFMAVDSVAPRRFGLIGSTPVRPGVHQYRVSAKYLDLCIEYLGRGTRESSFTTRVRPSEDYRMLKGQLQAIVYYTSTDLPKGVKLNAPFGLFSWASSQAEVDRINGAFTLASR